MKDTLKDLLELAYKSDPIKADLLAQKFIGELKGYNRFLHPFKYSIDSVTDSIQVTLESHRKAIKRLQDLSYEIDAELAQHTNLLSALEMEESSLRMRFK